MNPLVSICIPTFEFPSSGSEEQGVDMLTCLFKSIQKQTFKDFEIVISDQSVNSNIKNLCEDWKFRFKIVYITDSHRGSAIASLNNAIKHAKGKYIKIIYQDDFLVRSDTLKKMVECLENSKEKWVAIGCIHCNGNNTKKLFRPHVPKWVDSFKLALGFNKIGSPSVTMYENNSILQDEKLTWLVDCEFYYRLRRATTKPVLLNDIGVVIRLRKDSITNTVITPEMVKEEKLYVKIKHQQNILPDVKQFPIMYERLQRCKLI